MYHNGGLYHCLKALVNPNTLCRRIDSLTSKVASVDFFAFKPGAYELAMAHLYDHPTKSFLEVRCPVTCVYVLPDPSNPQR